MITALRLTICVVALAGLGWSVALKCGWHTRPASVRERFIVSGDARRIAFNECSRHEKPCFVMLPVTISSHWGGLLPSVGRNLSNRVVALYFPVTLLILIFALTSMLTAVPLVRRRRKGCCVRCGYDLRGTPEKCPECGFDASVQCSRH
jgi:hypothetical protein